MHGMTDSTCSFDCIFWMLAVSFLWGLTNPFLRVVSKCKQQVQPTHSSLKGIFFSIIVPSVNALQMLFTALISHLLGERLMSCRSTSGSFLILSGTCPVFFGNHLSIFPFCTLRGRERVWTSIIAVPNRSPKILSEESNEPFLPPSRGIIEDILGILLLKYAEPQLRASQIQLDKNAEPPWDPDPTY
uniref:Transmembrane protein 234 homolog n=1 Tax=Heterorhabditis bacteriophora TaxID=37862 RepID=A0A1I7W8B4_HETBA